MLQSRKGVIRFFPAMSSTWKDAVFENLRTEGAFLVSGRWRDGAVDWIRIKSLAGEPCRIRVHFDQLVCRQPSAGFYHQTIGR
jgi:hypothetical protein